MTLETIQPSHLATITGGGFRDWLFPKQAPTVTAAPGGVSIGGNVTGSVITTSPGSPGVAIEGNVNGGSIINGVRY